MTKKWTTCCAQLEGELPSRRYGDAVRLEVADNCPAEMTGYLLQSVRADRRRSLSGERSG